MNKAVFSTWCQVALLRSFRLMFLVYWHFFLQPFHFLNLVIEYPLFLTLLSFFIYWLVSNNWSCYYLSLIFLWAHWLGIYYSTLESCLSSINSITQKLIYINVHFQISLIEDCLFITNVILSSCCDSCGWFETAFVQIYFLWTFFWFEAFTSCTKNRWGLYVTGELFILNFFLRCCIFNIFRS